MPLNKDRLKNKLLKIFDECRKDTGNGDESKEKFADLLADAILEEVQELTITYTTGLIAPSSGGPVTGVLTVKLS